MRSWIITIKGNGLEMETMLIELESFNDRSLFKIYSYNPDTKEKHFVFRIWAKKNSLKEFELLYMFRGPLGLIIKSALHE